MARQKADATADGLAPPFWISLVM